MSQAQAILITLKNVLKSKNLTYDDLAQKLGLNETSVKRLMTGRVPMTLDRLEKICELTGIEVFDLLKLARPKAQENLAQLSIEQEHALAEDSNLFICFYALAKGLHFDEIVAKYKVSQSAAQKSFFQLEKLGLIQVRPENKVKFLVPRMIGWQENGPLSKKFGKQLEADFLNSEFSQSEEFRKFITLPLSERSRSVIILKLKELCQSVEDQSDVDLAVDKGLRKTATMLIGFREWTPSLLAKYLR